MAKWQTGKATGNRPHPPDFANSFAFAAEMLALHWYKEHGPYREPRARDALGDRTFTILRSGHYLRPIKCEVCRGLADRVGSVMRFEPRPGLLRPRYEDVAKVIGSWVRSKAGRLRLKQGIAAQRKTKTA